MNVSSPQLYLNYTRTLLTTRRSQEGRQQDLLFFTDPMKFLDVNKPKLTAVMTMRFYDHQYKVAGGPRLNGFWSQQVFDLSFNHIQGM